MSDTTGKIGWIDMTVGNAAELRDFYAAVVGWTCDEVSMGDYSDYSMKASDGETVSGICHARGSNADLPGGWLIYITVEDAELSAAACEKMGGEVLVPVRSLAGGRFCVIRDPSGATAALYQA
jgi:predicted enzyme related to lactoylglutathione lyase